MRSDLRSLRSANANLKLLVSLEVKAATFASVVGDEDSLRNLTTSLEELHADEVIDGLEVDWEWPVVTSADKKDREKLLRLTRVRKSSSL